ncbi:thiamine pyrophosphate-binding protein [Paenarthrobacter sp. S56]|uniref:thiamine pyrophosphate-binding protein n=1 Tax=Paenarthrobacter sp. S56 TaxID=3138179 RepID=UPI003218F0B4
MTVTTNRLEAAVQPTALGELVPSNVSELVGFTLARLGVGHVFGVVGSGNFSVTNALRKAGVAYTAARHEGGAATMADAYGRMSGKVGVVSTHQGCGLTNAITGIGEAAKSRTPLIVVTADTAASAVGSNFKIDQDGLARSVGAVAERVHSPASAVADTVRAYRKAVNERRTVVLSLPTDIQAAAVEGGPRRGRARSSATADRTRVGCRCRSGRAHTQRGAPRIRCRPRSPRGSEGDRGTGRGCRRVGGDLRRRAWPL